MTTVAFVTTHNRWPWRRQIGPATAPGLDFMFQDSDGAQWIVIYDDIAQPLRTDIPRSRRILFIGEPPGIKIYPPAYLKQFGTVVSPVPFAIDGVEVRIMQPALPWMAGVRFEDDGERTATFDIEGWRSLQPSRDKRAALSAVISSKSQLPRHRERLALVEALSRRLGERFSVYGRGFQPIADKADAILPFRYHLALENNDIPHFWTEKLADAFLGWALPVYGGCANVTEYFPGDSLVEIDVLAPEATVARIEALLDEDPWEKHLPAIAEARRRLLDDHNLFSVIARIIAAAPSNEDGRVSETLWPARETNLAGRLRAGAKRVLKGKNGGR